MKHFKIYNKKSGVYLTILIVLSITAFIFVSKKGDSQLKPDFPAEQSKWNKKLESGDDPQALYREIIDEYKNRPFTDQHYSLHNFGRILYKNLGKSSITICDESYGYGCIHGISLEAIPKKGISEVQILAGECKKFSRSVDVIECEHGIGHGIVEFMGNNEENLSKSLEACGNIKQCFGGVFMEYNHPVEHSVDTTKVLARAYTPQAPYAPCENLDATFKEVCFQRLPQWWDASFSHSTQVLGNLCARIQQNTDRDSCYTGIGYSLARDITIHPLIMREECEKIQDERGVHICKKAAAKSITLRTVTLERAHIICDGLQSCMP